jgi:hypothetical protein
MKVINYYLNPLIIKEFGFLSFPWLVYYIQNVLKFHIEQRIEVDHPILFLLQIEHKHEPIFPGRIPKRSAFGMARDMAPAVHFTDGPIFFDEHCGKDLTAVLKVVD